MLLPTSKILPKLPNHKALISLAEFSAREKVRLYLVGGTIRDAILNRPICDLDFSLSVNAIEFAENFARILGVKFIVLDEEQKTARLIFYNGDLYMDFSTIRGNDIFDDLLARDLTINAMAIDFSQLMNSESVDFLDPYNGIDDLNNKIVKIPSSQTIMDDPLRMLRVYRFSATLGFSIHEDTTNLIGQHSKLLKESSIERIRDELYKILEVSNSSKYLKAIDSVGLLEQIFPEIIPMKGMTQNEYHHLDVWEHSMLALEFLECQAIPDSLKEHQSEIDNYLNFEIVKGRNRISLLKLATLLHDIGKPMVRTIDKNGRIRFFDHHKKGAEMALSIGNRLRLANREAQSMSNIVEYHMYPLFLCSRKHHVSQRKSLRDIRQFIQKTGSECLSVLITAFADSQATQGIWRSEDDLENISRLIGKIANTYFSELDSPMTMLLTGDELMESFGLSQGPEIGKILNSVKEAQINGVIKDRRDAMNFVRKILDKSNRG